MSHRSLPVAGRRRLAVAGLALLAAPALVLGCAKTDQVSTGASGTTGTTAGTAVPTTVPAESDAAGQTEPACASSPGPDPRPDGTGAVTTIPPTTSASDAAAAAEGVAPECAVRPGAPHPTPGRSTPTTCVPVPATTTPIPGQGGGELACSSPDDPVSSEPGARDGGSASSPPMTAPAGEPDVPGIPPALTPDATHGVLSGNTGGSPCPPAAEACVAMYQLVPATIVVTPAAGGPPVTTVESDGAFGVLLAPGSYVLTTTPTKDTDRVCPPTTVEVGAGTTTSISIDCAKQG